MTNPTDREALARVLCGTVGPFDNLPWAMQSMMHWSAISDSYRRADAVLASPLGVAERERVRVDEREACAKVAMKFAGWVTAGSIHPANKAAQDADYALCKDIAAAIRERNKGASVGAYVPLADIVNDTIARLTAQRDALREALVLLADEAHKAAALNQEPKP